MYEFGTIVLVPFPFTDLSATKVRPALIVSRSDHRGDDVIVCFITSKIIKENPDQLILESNERTGLKTRSAIRFDKIATLDKKVILGELGKADANLLRKHKGMFLGMFGFGEE